jgi:chemotaxis protein methyltransferase CheR
MTGSEEAMPLIEELLSVRLGLVFGGAKRDLLRNRLRQRMAARGVASHFDYFILLRRDEGEEWDLLIDAVTNGETYFFREADRIATFLDALPPGGGKELRVLSAGCSTGEEAYTLAIILGERLGWTRRVLIDAIDVDEARLERARGGQYEERSLRAASEEQRAQYFQRLEGGSWLVREPYRSMARFHRANLLDAASHRAEAPYDAIFCRNVLIYFSDAAIDAALETMARWLRPGGVLSLGHSESIVGRTPLFRAERSGETIVYRRAEEAAEGRGTPRMSACG